MMSRLFNDKYFDDLEELGEITTEKAIKNFKSRSGLTRYEILDITGQKTKEIKHDKCKWFNMIEAIELLLVIMIITFLATG